MSLIHSCLLCCSIQIKIVSTSATQKSHGLSPSGCQSEERYTYAQSIHLCLFTVLFGENMLHVLLALLVLHFELMQFILIYDNCLKDLLSIFPFIKKLFTQKGKSSREIGLLGTVRWKNQVDSILE